MPSIEKSASESIMSLPHSKRAHDAYYDGRSEDSWAQSTFERQYPSRQVVVDDIHPSKRRRLMYEHQDGHFESQPHQAGSMPTLRRESHLLPSTAASPRDGFSRVYGESLLSPKDMSRGSNPRMVANGSARDLPVYDISEHGNLRRVSERLPDGRRSYAPDVHRESAVSHQVQPHQSMRASDFHHLEGHSTAGGRDLSQISPAFPVRSNVSRSYSTVADSMRTVSSQLESSFPQPRENVGFAPQQSAQTYTYGYEPHADGAHPAQMVYVQHPESSVSRTK